MAKLSPEEIKIGQKAIGQFRKFLRSYNTVLWGDVGLGKAYVKFLSDYNIKPLKPTKRQIEGGAQLAKIRNSPDREKIARTPIETHKYKNKRYLTLDSIDQIIASLPKPVSSPELREKIFETIYYHKFPNAVRYKIKPILHDIGSEELTNKIIALIDGEEK